MTSSPGNPLEGRWLLRCGDCGRALSIARAPHCLTRAPLLGSEGTPGLCPNCDTPQEPEVLAEGLGWGDTDEEEDTPVCKCFQNMVLP